ncbi:hypothetical protein MJL27_27220, partial [Salmonella enterica subsp. enterica serovar Anatum]|nr:hypothetical protein [Salmonella enterica subsp. enterica serovar Anatum]
EIILHLPANARSDLRSLPPNVRLVDWLPMGVFLNGADGFIHHADAGELGSNGILPDVDSLRIPVQYLANLLTAGDTQPVLLALK